MAVSRGEAVRVGFRHSVYGSSVEEHFEVAEGGLRLVRLRYGEARLAEFYGHEHVVPADGHWIVDVPATLHATLPLRVSRDSAMRVATPSRVVPLTDWVGNRQSALVTLSVEAR